MAKSLSELRRQRILKELQTLAGPALVITYETRPDRIPNRGYVIHNGMGTHIFGPARQEMIWAILIGRRLHAAERRGEVRGVAWSIASLLSPAD